MAPVNLVHINFNKFLFVCVFLGVNAAVVLVVLLLAVPLQLFLSHYLAQVYTDGSHATVEFNGPGKLGPSSSGERTTVASGDVGASEAKGIEATRKEAANR